MLQKIPISNKRYSFELSIHQIIPQFFLSWFPNFFNQKTVLNIDNNDKMILQICILEGFLKDHVTLKTGVMMLKIHHRN